jgi:acyl-CoA reductase-like NAD-dependent aldehyde dehydrogenase
MGEVLSPPMNKGPSRMTVETYQMLINGAWVDASDGARFDSVNPATGNVWASVPEATAADVDRAVRAADAALTGDR